ncbi:GntR family transcriptional regulator [Lapidilactobacillus bayanensis]|uniref:GntR family transcriptional regulator n=1 Tax=Lapidilactobacillus bayanensis TaxID=2485998 RepID=UPI000F7AA998|nr:GntR family transcriptional regulator [Lapidilactobacillus bayanensis]
MEKKYQIVIDAVEKWINIGKYQANDKLPTESELMNMFNVSRHTVRKSLSDLETKGVVYRIQGGGTFVAEEKRGTNAFTDNQIIAVLTTHINDYIFPSIISGIESELSRKSISLTLSSTQNNEDVERKELLKLLNGGINGLIVEPTKSAFNLKNFDLYDELIKSGLPIITINSHPAQLNIPYFVMDDFRGGQVATEYLLHHNHTNILGIFKTDDQQGIDRMNGFTDEMQRSQLTSNAANLLFQSGDSKQRISQHLLDCLSSSNRPTAIICYNDQVAVITYNLAVSLGMRIPQDLSIIGFDNSTLSHSFGIQLTSIDHPKDKMGHDAAGLMIKMLDNPTKDYSTNSEIYRPIIIEGDSVVKI